MVYWLEIKQRLKFNHYHLLVSRYISADLMAKLVYCIGFLPPIKYWLSAIILNSSFFRTSTSTLAFYLCSMTCV